MPVSTTGAVSAVLVERILDNAPPGSIKFYRTDQHTPAGFHFRCPCGCDTIGGVTVTGPSAWRWNGSRDRPTVRPSVLLHDHDGPHWHGWLTDGVWRSC